MSDRMLIFSDIDDEREKQLKKWGEQRHPDGTNPVAYKPLADHAREKCQKADSNGMVTWLDILREEVMEAFAEREWPDLRKELIQSAAVIVAWVEDGDKRK